MILSQFAEVILVKDSDGEVSGAEDSDLAASGKCILASKQSQILSNRAVQLNRSSIFVLASPEKTGKRRLQRVPQTREEKEGKLG